MKSTQIRHTLLLLLTALIWGCAFVAQQVGADYVGPFTFLALRSYLGGLVLLPAALFRRRRLTWQELKAGVLLGLWLTAASYFQQAGVGQTTVAKAGFITTLYVIFVPFLTFLLYRKRVSARIWFCVALSLVGLYLLSHMTLALSAGDWMVLLCALLFSGHILTVDHYSQTTDGLTISCIQFLTVAVLSTSGMLLKENPDWSAIQLAGPSILYAGILSSGVGYTLQIIGQKGVNPTIASLAMSLESAFAALAAWVILGQKLSPAELVGCLLMFVSIVLAQLPDRSATMTA
ncbi:DMT family transporter [Oscillospiraceae bacterium HV4-5-C5C]|nr:DMT family transporter [Oscillospiraceae bacterium HV4-5-C5C]